MGIFLLYLQAFCRSAVLLIFAFSFLGKVRHTATFQQTIANFALVPKKLHRPVAWLCLGAEVLVVLLMLPGGLFLLSGYVLAGLMLLAFSLAMASVLLRRLSTTCSCFGPSTQPIKPIDLVRNAGFLICVAGGCLTLSVPGGTAYLNLLEWSLVSLGSLAFVLIWTQLSEIARLFS
jgi:hypothetical protein